MSTHVRKYTLMLVCLLSGLMSATLLAAQTARVSQPTRRFFTYNPANELVLNGTIQEVVTARRIGSPPGMHLLIRGPQGSLDAHVGSFLAKDVQAALRPGASVKVVGAIELLHGQQYLLARQLEFNGRVITVRSSRGFLLRSLPSGTTRVAARNSARNGGR